MFLFKITLMMALVAASALAISSKGLEQQREEQVREEPQQQVLLAKLEETSDRKLPAQRAEAKGEDKKPLEVIKIEQQERGQQQSDEQDAVKAAPVEQVVREEPTKRATFPPPIQQQRDESPQLEEARGEQQQQVQIKQELELPQKQQQQQEEEIKGAEVRQLEYAKRQPEVLLRASADVGTRFRSSWATKDSIDRRPVEALKSEHREEARLENKPLAPVKTYAKAYGAQEAPKMYTLGRLFGGNSQYSADQSSSYYQPSYQASSYGYPYYYQPAQSYNYGSYYRGPTSATYTTGGSYTRYSGQPQTTSYLYPAQRQPVYVREYYLPATTYNYQSPQATAYSTQPSNYRLHYSEQAKIRRNTGLSVDEHTPVIEE